MRDATLIREACLRASGADIHEVKNLVCAYEEVCAIRDDPDSSEALLFDVFKGRRKALVKWAAKCEETYERSRRAYTAGVPARLAIQGVRGRDRRIRSVKAFAKITKKRLRRIRLLGWVV